MEAKGRAEARPEVVVLIHGLWMTGAEMSLLARRLSRCGFICHRFRYRSIARTPADNAAALQAYLGSLDAPVVHLVAHSLGGILLLHLFHRFPRQRPGRVVLLGSPVGGSSMAEVLAGRTWTRPLLGRSIDRGLLGGAPAWGVDRETAVIAGTFRLGTAMILGGAPAPSDGTVSVAETRLPGAAHRCIKAAHFGLLFSPTVARWVCGFLKTGSLGDAY